MIPNPGFTSGPGFSLQQNSQYLPSDGATWVEIQPEPITPSDPNLQMARPSRPWRMYARVVGLVILVFFFEQIVAGAIIEALNGDILFSSVCLAFSIPFLLAMVAMRRPRIILLERAIPDPNGKVLHAITSHEGSLSTPMPTRMGRHLIRDDSILDVPTSKASWILFTCTVLFSIILAILSAIGAYILVLPLLIPTILIGFSIPVMGWWSHSTHQIGLPTRKRDAEAWLMAGMLSGLPAIVINSSIFPGIIQFITPNISADVLFALTVSISAPVGEEFCKGVAILFFANRIKSPKHGFQIGFTVGLGFAIVENLMYISNASVDPVALGFTTLIRGIGSIPGHAFWTSLTGAGIGWHLMQKRANELHLKARDGQKISTPLSGDKNWKIFNPKTGIEIDSVQPEPGIQTLSSGVKVWLPPQAIGVKDPLLKIPLPKSPALGLLLAMLGHAFWNGSSIVVDFVALQQGMGEIGRVILQLMWIVFLVIGVLLIGMGLLSSVRDAPDGAAVDSYQQQLAEITNRISR
ncbi:MAG: PrsW family glutamic-type intramembrane protease [Candidatus Thalassarchaeaceae archaeon]|nr:PrsW family glutamic-type intramembrane protease [Candidatus Thalassarchaeaceae archaeon]